MGFILNFGKLPDLSLSNILKAQTSFFSGSPEVVMSVASMNSWNAIVKQLQLLVSIAINDRNISSLKTIVSTQGANSY